MAEREERDRILDKARERFLHYGFAKVTLDEIASDLGMSKKTLYKHFASKEELLKEVVRSLTRALSARIEKIVSSDLSFEAKARKILTDIGTTLSRFDRQLQADVQRYVPDLWEEIEEFRRQQILDKLDRMFRQGIREDIFRRNLNPEIFTLVFIGAVQAIINPTVLSNRSFSAAEAFSAILEILFEGALSERSRQSIRVFDPTFPTSS
jgi:AcrR family transcriptional regulator